MVEITIKDLCSGFGDSRIGGRLENQDSFGKDQTNRGGLVVVCDGMGGGPGGKTASQIAVNEIIQGVIEADPSETNSNALIKAIRRANMAIIQKGDDVPQLKGMGSTVVAVLLSKQAVTIAHVGDSRVYQFRKGKKIFRTFDHSMVFELVKQKVITEEQARLSAQSNIITRALGIKPDVDVEIEERPYETGDRFLLCTDGIHGTMPEQELIKIVSSLKFSLGATVDNLVTKVDMLGCQKGGGHDNLTAIILEMKSNSILKEKMSKRIKNILLCLSSVLIISIIFNVMLATKKSTLEQGVLIKANVTTLLAKNQQLEDSIMALRRAANANSTNSGELSEFKNKLKGQIDKKNKKIEQLEQKNIEKDSITNDLKKKLSIVDEYDKLLRKFSSQFDKWITSKKLPEITDLKQMRSEINNVKDKIKK